MSFMHPENKANLEKLCAELDVIQARLSEISDASFGDMEGADMPDFSISEELWSGCLDASKILSEVTAACRKLAK